MHRSSRLPFKSARPAEIKHRLEAGEAFRFIDVRERDEYQAARVEAAELLPMSEIQSWWQELPRDQEIVIMCHHGIRSAQVCTALNRAGFEHLTNLEGGIEAWSRDVDPNVPRY